ncbi:MAG: RluA family pseudouridine synthase [Candidatus Omnitrophica bacterium]|jgi:23S rRNA pseudouridine1911/1915/1917 synthase|nr:RluA family pseudouridine synthase [Candidatus Omnitrophota bacterium]
MAAPAAIEPDKIMNNYTITVAPEDSGRRLDVFLMAFSKASNLGLSRTAIQSMMRQDFVKVNGKTVSKPNYKVAGADHIDLTVEEHKPDQPLVAEDIPLEVVYEDADLAVVNKPPGLVVHPAPGNALHTLVQALLFRFKHLSTVNPLRPGIVHRLDKETSGLLVIAKNNPAHHALAAQFADHSIKRKYVALVKGRVEYDENVIELSIGRHPKKREHMAVSSGVNARYAKTRYRTLKRSKTLSLLELEPYTGRTHQLRVHLSYIGHPIMGDTKYGRQVEFARMALHAKYLGFIHPGSGKFVEFETKTPKEFSDAVKQASSD